MQKGIVYVFLFIFSSVLWQCCADVYMINSSQPLEQGQVLVSSGNIFELGVFDDDASNKYLGLWHKNIFPRKVVWVANREKPVIGNLSSLKIGSDGNLELADGVQNLVWSTNITARLSSSNSSTSAFAILLDTGNFVVKNITGDVVWQSFDYPSDTLLAGQLLGFDSKSGKKNFLTSWKGDNDPSVGLFVYGLTPDMPTQAFIWLSNGSTPFSRSGPWDRTRFIGIPGMVPQYISGTKVDDDVIQGKKYLSYMIFDSYQAYVWLSSEGRLGGMASKNGSNWVLSSKQVIGPCDVYGVCGPFGVCTTSESPMCKCLEKFVPKSNEEWSKQNWTGGCVRKTKLFCERNTSKSVSSRGNDGFQKRVGLKVPDFHEYITTLKEDTSEGCKMYCLNNCSCLAYAYVSTIGCLVWSKELIDMQVFPVGGTEMFIRIAHADLGGDNQIKLIASLTAICLISVFCSVLFIWHKVRTKRKGKVQATKKHYDWTGTTMTCRDTLQLLREQNPLEQFIYAFDSIIIATNNFSITNKLGEGGFGPVYKGKLQDGNEIAVKRLSRSSRQGIEEFKNEMFFISKLQHKNLVRIIGCCVKDDEKLLIYEFMPNKSLHHFLFDSTKRAVLHWDRRFNIIHGVARGLLYLHHDSCLKVIHRDLKTSNILLDEEMNPKISDFGLSHIVQREQNLLNTQKVVGTRGYMSPEYARGGIFSEKSDVYSFGVLLLEIITGRKNTGFHYNEQQLGFLAYAWHLWSEDKGLDLADEALTGSYSSSELLRCLHIGLLCVQDNAADRPTMSDVVFMLSSTVIDGPEPKQPTFEFHIVSDPRNKTQDEIALSANEATMSVIEGR